MLGSRPLLRQNRYMSKGVNIQGKSRKRLMPCDFDHMASMFTKSYGKLGQKR